MTNWLGVPEELPVCKLAVIGSAGGQRPTLVIMKCMLTLSVLVAALVASVAASSSQFSSSYVADLGQDFEEKARLSTHLQQKSTPRRLT